MQKGKKHKRRWHRWLGLPLGFILIVFALSGIVLNHRHFFSAWEVNRSILPSLFQYKDWNNGFIRGSFELPNPQEINIASGELSCYLYSDLSDIVLKNSLDSLCTHSEKKLEVLVYGNDGIWLTDRGLTTASSLNDGFPQGVDNRGIRSVVMDPYNILWAITQTDMWRYDYKKRRWRHQELPIPTERLSDLIIQGDSLLVVGRSHLFIVDLKEYNQYKELKEYNQPKVEAYEVTILDSDQIATDQLDSRPHYSPTISHLEINSNSFGIITINPSEEYSGGGRQTLFRIMLKIHSGEILGLKGRVFMDVIAIVFILMSISGIVFYFVKKRKSCKVLTRILFKYHKRLGVIAFVLLFFVVLTGWTLRPPALIALVTSNVGLEGGNVWEDKLRSLRYDQGLEQWILSTSDGFYSLDSLEAIPQKVEAAPAVSVMGVNVWEPNDQGWLLGSFSGMYLWDTRRGRVWDYFTREEVETSHKQGPPFGKRAVAGHFLQRPVEFYNGIDMGVMPEKLRHEPISLWNLALEVHTGRIYTFLGPLTTVFIFIFGSLIMWLLISGLKRVWRKNKSHTQKKNTLSQGRE